MTDGYPTVLVCANPECAVATYYRPPNGALACPCCKRVPT